MPAEIQDLARRLEQQLTAYEHLHTDELKRLQDQIAAFQHLQNDEFQMLRNELSQLKQALGAIEESGKRLWLEREDTQVISG
ncbi:MAG: hypothetical protein HY868_08800 [Chloroflexi bacterium]|nr:hypothetical protein [Chloroflexota bacterium]